MISAGGLSKDFADVKTKLQYWTFIHFKYSWPKSINVGKNNYLDNILQKYLKKN